MATTERAVLRRNRSFVLLLAANGIRGMAFWLCWLGMLALTSYELDATAGQSAMILGATSLPHILFSPFTGALVDRTNAKWTMAATFVWNIGTAVSLLFVTDVWQVYIVAFAWSAAGAIVWPSLGSLIKGLVPDRDLVRANGILNSLWEATLIVGPALSGLLAAKFSPRAPMAVGAVLYAAGLLVLVPLRFTPVKAPKPVAGHRIREMREGLSLVLRLPDLRALALWGAVAWGGFSVLIGVEPVFVRDFLHGDQSMLGLMYSIGGIGATLGALGIGWFVLARRELFLAGVGLAMVGGFFAVYVGWARWPHVLPVQALIGTGFAIYATLTQSLVQRRAPREVVGRALAAKRAIEETAGLIAAVTAGAIASTAGTRTTMFAAAVLMTVAAFMLIVRARALPEQSSAIEPGEPGESGGSGRDGTDGLSEGSYVGDPVHDLGAPVPLGFDPAP